MKISGPGAWMSNLSRVLPSYNLVEARNGVARVMRISGQTRPEWSLGSVAAVARTRSST
jgi:hypothetical protein